ncbi:MAG: hypothetical protein KAT90_08790 [Gammaproteobacteria bacterium]|nr:hypothetical protein [Gammaproteobacteria bacterium]
MKIFKYLIKPLEWIVLLGMLAALIYFRSIIFHSNVNQYIDMALVYAGEQLEIEIPAHVNNDIELTAVAQVECEPTEVYEVKNNELAGGEKVLAVDNKELVADEPDLTSVAVKSGDDKVLIETLSSAVSAISEKVDALFNETKTKAEPAAELVLDEKKTEVIASSVDKKDAVAVAESPSVDTEQVLYTARKLFWSGNARASETLYLQLINLDSSDPNAYGELGNVYYTQGKWKQAGGAYYEAAVRLLGQKNNDQVANRVSYLLRVIQGLDTESAEKLRKKIAG